MERDFIRDDFENFLKQESNQHKINPSEKTWKNIYNIFVNAKKEKKIFNEHGKESRAILARRQQEFYGQNEDL